MGLHPKEISLLGEESFEMNSKKQGNRLLALLLSFCMLLTMVPVTAFAAGTNGTARAEDECDVLMLSLIHICVLADGAVTVAYSYIGPELTFPIYRNGSIGMAKRHLSQTAATMMKEYSCLLYTS